MLGMCVCGPLAVAPIDFATWLAPLDAEAALPALFSAPATRYGCRPDAPHVFFGRRPNPLNESVGKGALGTRWALQQLTMRLLSQFVDLHNGQTAVTVLVRPFTATLARAAPQLKRWPASVKVWRWHARRSDRTCAHCGWLTATDMPTHTQADLEALHGRLATVIAGADSKRYPCQLQRHKPVALKEYAPRFDETYVWDAPRTPTRANTDAGRVRGTAQIQPGTRARPRRAACQRTWAGDGAAVAPLSHRLTQTSARATSVAQAKKLARTYKQELKSAKRELRKDSAFLAEVQLKERLEKDQEYNAKIKSIYSSVGLANGAAALRLVDLCF